MMGLEIYLDLSRQVEKVHPIIKPRPHSIARVSLYDRRCWSLLSKISIPGPLSQTSPAHGSGFPVYNQWSSA